MITARLIKIYFDRFINRPDVWGKQWTRGDGTAPYAYQYRNMDTKHGRFQFEPLTPNLLRYMFDGDLSCALSAVDGELRSRWLCFDSDTEDGDLDELEVRLRGWGLHALREGRRPGRAGHLWILFDHPVPADQLIVLGDAMIRLARVRAASSTYAHGIERFPKSTNGFSLVRAPFSINLKPEANGARGWFDGAKTDVEAQLEWLVVQPLNSAKDAIHEAERHRPPKEPTIRNQRRYSTKMTNYINILDHVDHRRVGNDLVAQCPLCAQEGHDRSRDNLHITRDGSKFCCVFGGPSQVHQAKDIIDHLRR